MINVSGMCNRRTNDGRQNKLIFFNWSNNPNWIRQVPVISYSDTINTAQCGPLRHESFRTRANECWSRYGRSRSVNRCEIHVSPGNNVKEQHLLAHSSKRINVSEITEKTSSRKDGGVFAPLSSVASRTPTSHRCLVVTINGSTVLSVKT